MHYIPLFRWSKVTAWFSEQEKGAGQYNTIFTIQYYCTEKAVVTQLEHSVENNYNK